MLGLFPGLCEVGGIQASGLLAWEALTQDARLAGCAKRLVCYDPFREHDAALPASQVVIAPTNLKAWQAAHRLSRDVSHIFVWHLSLLRFVPLYRSHSVQLTLFLHGIEAWKKPSFWLRRMLPQVNTFLSNSQHTWQTFLQFYPPAARARHLRVPLGIGAPSSEIVPRPAEVPAALMLGRLLQSENYKGHREVISAWPQVLAQLPHAELWIAGDGDLTTELRQLAEKLGVSQQVRFFGRVTEAEKQSLLARARCLALPSRGEGFGLVYLEAMRLGRPCLVSGLDGGSEVVNPPEAGLAAAPQHRDALAAALCRLLADTPEWAQWSAQARRRYETHFTARSFQDRLVSALINHQTPDVARAA